VGSDGLTARALRSDDVTVQQDMGTYGDVLVAGSTLPSHARVCTGSEHEWRRWVRSQDTLSAGFVTLRGRGPVRAVQGVHNEAPSRFPPCGALLPEQREERI